MEEQATLLEAASAEYVGRWNRLVSTTNWEKGRIICQWRESLRQAGAPVTEYGDEAWSRQVGHVTPQHVGRLRRVYERFGDVFEQYPGLYWSHFLAAYDWPDPEMYLQGAVDSGWSVSEMRNQRWEALGAPAELKPRDTDVMTAELDEDFSADDDGSLPGTISESVADVQDAEEMRDDESDAYIADDDEQDASGRASSAIDAPPAAPLRPFEDLPPLPSDLNEAFELMKLAILNHKVSGWQEIARDDVLAVLESLRQLVLAPSE